MALIRLNSYLFLHKHGKEVELISRDSALDLDVIKKNKKKIRIQWL